MARYEGSTTYTVSSGRWGVPTTVYEKTVTVGTTPTRILGNNPRRLYHIIVNNGANPVKVGFSEEILGTAGILISAEGGMISLDVETDGEVVGYEVYGKADGGSSTVYVAEVVALE